MRKEWRVSLPWNGTAEQMLMYMNYATMNADELLGDSGEDQGEDIFLGEVIEGEVVGRGLELEAGEGGVVEEGVGRG
jgi:hypothetical protein